jgi:hypothetical protein
MCLPYTESEMLSMNDKQPQYVVEPYEGKFVISILLKGRKKYIAGDWCLCDDAESATKYDSQEWAEATVHMWNSDKA